MSELGEPSSIVQQRLVKVARAFGIDAARVSAFPTYFMVSMGSGEPVVLELTTAFGVQLRLDQFAAIDRLVGDAEAGDVTAAEGLRRLEEIGTSAPRFGRPTSILGYCILTVGLCLILHPTGSDVAAAAVFGVVVGVLRMLGSTRPNLQVLMPVLASFVVSVLAATAVDHDLIDPALRAVVASLVVFLPGATLTTAVLELAAGQMISGASRLVAGAVQLALLAFGILAGVEAVGLSSSLVLSVGGQRLGEWAPWLGVFVFAVGVATAHSAPKSGPPGVDRGAVHRVDRPARRQHRARRVRQRVRRCGGDDAGGVPRRPATTRHARPGIVPARVLAPRTGSARSHRADGTGGRCADRRHEGSRRHGGVDLRHRHRCAVRHDDDRRRRVDQGLAHEHPGERRAARAVEAPAVQMTLSSHPLRMVVGTSFGWFRRLCSDRLSLS